MATLNQKALLDMLNPDGAQGAMPMPPIEGGSAAQNAGEPGGFAGPAAGGAPRASGSLMDTATGATQTPAVQPPKVTVPGSDVNGGGFAGDATAPAAPPAPNYSMPGAFQGAMRGFNADKLASKADPKYDVGRVLSQFDPKQGITPDVLTALNSLNEGTFALKPGSKDYLTLGGNVDPRWNGMTGADAVFSEGGPDAAWTLQGDGPGWNQDAAAQPQGHMGGGMSAGSINPMLSGDPLAAIQQALGAYQNSPNLKALLAQLGGQ